MTATVTVYSVSIRKFSYTSHVKRNGCVYCLWLPAAIAVAIVFYSRPWVQMIVFDVCCVCVEIIFVGIWRIHARKAKEKIVKPKSEGAKPTFLKSKKKIKSEKSEEKTNDSSRENTKYTNTHTQSHRETDAWKAKPSKSKSYTTHRRSDVFTQHTYCKQCARARAYIIITFFLSIFYIKQHQQATNTQKSCKRNENKSKNKRRDWANCVYYTIFDVIRRSSSVPPAQHQHRTHTRDQKMETKIII